MTPVFEDKNKPLSAEMRAKIIDKLSGAIFITGNSSDISAWIEELQMQGVKLNAFDRLDISTIRGSLDRAKYEAMTDECLMATVLGSRNE